MCESCINKAFYTPENQINKALEGWGAWVEAPQDGRLRSRKGGVEEPAAGASHQTSGDGAALVSCRLPAGLHRFMSASGAHSGEVQ